MKNDRLIKLLSQYPDNIDLAITDVYHGNLTLYNLKDSYLRLKQDGENLLLTISVRDIDVEKGE